MALPMPFDEIGRAAGRCRGTRQRRRRERILNAQPPEIQRDLDWNPPPSPMAKVFRWTTKAIRR